MSKRKSEGVSSGDRYNDKAIILKVASLIEQGSEGMQQITGRYFDRYSTGCCSMGAMLKALGYDWSDTQTPIAMLNILGIYSWPHIAYPKGFGEPFAANEQLETAPLPDVIIFLNDRLGWSFSEIVDYLRDCTLPQATIISIKA